jgi:hypothetical protein
MRNIKLKKKTDMCGEFGFMNSTIKMIWKNKTKIISASEQKGLRIKQFWKPEQSDVDDALLKWFKKHRSENVPASDLMIVFVPKF